MPHHADVVACFQQAQFVSSTTVAVMTTIPKLGQPTASDNCHCILKSSIGCSSFVATELTDLVNSMSKNLKILICILIKVKY